MVVFDLAANLTDHAVRDLTACLSYRTYAGLLVVDAAVFAAVDEVTGLTVSAAIP